MNKNLTPEENIKEQEEDIEFLEELQKEAPVSEDSLLNQSNSAS